MTTSHAPARTSLRSSLRASFGLAAALALLGCGGAELYGTDIDPFTGEELTAEAVSLDMNKLVNDADILGGGTITTAKVQAFLTKKGGALKSYRDPAFGNRTAADLIVANARAQGVSPVYILARIQTESSLVSGSNTSLIPQATGCGCPDSSGCSASYRGFGKQVECAAKKIKGYLNDLNAGRPTVSGWKVGAAKRSSDPCTVTPANKATAALYTYTPWVGAYARQCGRKDIGGSSLLGAILTSYKADPSLAP